MPARCRPAAVARWALLALPLAACDPIDFRSTGRPVAAMGSALGLPSEAELDDVTVRLPALSDSAIQLDGGLSDDPVRRRYVLRVAGFDAVGDFDGDGEGERAVLVTANRGGAQVFVNVVAFGEDDGAAIQEAVIQLGDRVHLHRFEAAGDTLLVEVAEHGPLDAACCPTRRIVRRYRIADARWVLVP